MSAPTEYVFPPYRLLPQQRQLLGTNGEAVKLGGRAFDVLLALVERRGRTVGKHELIDLVWPKLVVEENNLQVQMVTLRKLLGHAAVATVPGRGYRFTLPVTEVNPAPAEAAPAAAERAGGTGSPRHNLPPWTARLYGRDDDVRAVSHLLEAHALVTIAGPGGMGKSRLAQAVAAARIDAHADGVWWIDLAALSEPVFLDESVAQAMGLAVGGGADAAAGLWSSLPTMATLLVLDNAEHVLPRVAEFAERVRRVAPHARMLITTQAVLRLADEQVFRPEPLALPDGDDPAAIGASAAVALFVARAQAASRRFALNDDNGITVAGICRQLDGIPLALELAAARVELLGLQGLRDKLDQRLQVLTAGHRASPRRHQTLRAALEWSHQLLSAPEQVVLHRLGVFAGGFSLEAAQHVGEDDAIDRWDVLEHLGALVDKSFVAVEGDAVPRYRMLETTRLFALERLIESGTAADARTRHREHFIEVAEAARERMLVADPRGLRRLDDERDNLQLALAWNPAGADATPALRLALALRYYWTSRGLLARGLEVTRAALQLAGDAPASALKCLAQGVVGHFLGLMGDLDSARAEARAAVDMARSLADPGLLCLTLASLGFIHLRRGDRVGAAACADEAIALQGDTGDCRELGNALALRAAVEVQAGNDESALKWQQQTLALWQRLGHTWSQAVAHLNLTSMALDRGASTMALAHLRQVHALLPTVDSDYIGTLLIDVTSAWAEAAGLVADSVTLDAAGAEQMRRIGMTPAADPQRDDRKRRARAELDSHAIADLQAAGQRLAYPECVALVERLLGAGVPAGS